MELFKNQVSLEVLLESKIGKTLKYLMDFCSVYGEDMLEIEKLRAMCDRILMKWKNYLLNMFLD